MKKSVWSCVLAAVLLMFLLTSCSGGSATTTAGPPTQSTGQVDKTFTLDELSQYDGTNGRPAYVAVDGVVYDVSASQLWPAGVHTKCNLGAVAGKDLSSVITQAPANMRSLLARMPVVGHLEQ